MLLLLAFRRGPPQQSEAPPPPPPYRQLRYEEDYVYVREEDRRTDPFDALRYSPLSESGEIWLSLGREVRERYEKFHNANWGAGPQGAAGYFLQRYMTHADLHLGEEFRLFAQLKSGLEDGRTGAPRVPDEDRLDLHQAFGDWWIRLDPDRSQTLRAGRQEMAYGSSRLASPREGPNVRQSFDGIRAIAHVEEWRADVFLTRPVETDPGVFDDGSDRDRVFWGTYATTPVVEGRSLDLYYQGLDWEHATFDQGTADQTRHSGGARLWGRPEPRGFNLELVYQFGKFGPDRISAWTIASDTGLTLGDSPFEPRLGLKADVASGDTDPSDPDLGTFNALFPKGPSFAETDLVGPANLYDLHSSLELRLSANATRTADADFFWRTSRGDGTYSVSLNFPRPGNLSDERYIGSQTATALAWTFDRNLAATLYYAHFLAGPFLEEIPPGEDMDFVATWVTFEF